jgi:hypothetical protein
VQAGALGKTLARASTVGKPFKAYKPHQAVTTRKVVPLASRCLKFNLVEVPARVQAGALGKTLARALMVGKPSKAYKPY